MIHWLHLLVLGGSGRTQSGAFGWYELLKIRLAG